MTKPTNPTHPSAGSGSSSVGGATAACPCPTSVGFAEEEDKATFKSDKYKYGWDMYTETYPWKSVEKGQTDIIKAVIDPPATATRTDFTSADTAKATVSPVKASTAIQDLTVTGVETGETDVKATCDSGPQLGKFQVVVYPKKTITVAVRLVHLKDKYKSTDISDADIIERLRKVFKQAAVEIVVTRLPEMTVEFDKDGDGKLNMTDWGTDDQKAIIDACKDTIYNRNIFIVDKPHYPPGTLFGMMGFNQRYGFVHADNTTTPLKTLAHELGHGFGLEHKPTDTDNLMKQGLGDNMWLLRKEQWDKLRQSPVNPPN